MKETEYKHAHDVEVGEIIANVGVVDAINRVGVFLVFAVRGTIWSLATGKGNFVTRDFVLHEADEVAVGVTDR